MGTVEIPVFCVVSGCDVAGEWMKFVFWETFVSAIEIPAIRGLAELGHECTLVVDSLVSEKRTREGWPMPEPGAVRVVVAEPGKEGTAAMQGVMDASSPDTIHVVGGCHFCRTETYARRRCAAEGRRFGMVAEGGINLTWRRCLRRAKAWFYARKYRHHCDFLLAMGTTGVRWYRQAGYPAERIFPYLYTVENIPVENTAVATSVFRMAHVGTFDHRKGTDLLVQGLLRMAAAGAGNKERGYYNEAD